MTAFTLDSVFGTKWTYQGQIKAVCFDLFKTLVDVGQVPDSVGRFTTDILGVDRLLWREACFGPNHNIREPTDPFETLLKLARSLKPDISIDLVQQAMIERQFRFDYALTHVDKDILRSLQSIRNRNFRTGLIFNASSSEISAWPQSPLAELFDVATFSCECGHEKPEFQYTKRH
ncbi:MAG: hypothetical protein OEY52_10140 [Gammaproteobacteria bacterium]|nr:hypothetical protein [Gammaproteobacteria bacterium]